MIVRFFELWGLISKDSGRPCATVATIGDIWIEGASSCGRNEQPCSNRRGPPRRGPPPKQLLRAASKSSILTAGAIWSDLAPSVRESAIAAINRNLNRYTDT